MDAVSLGRHGEAGETLCYPRRRERPHSDPSACPGGDLARDREAPRLPPVCIWNQELHGPQRVCQLALDPLPGLL